MRGSIGQFCLEVCERGILEDMLLTKLAPDSKLNRPPGNVGAHLEISPGKGGYMLGREERVVRFLVHNTARTIEGCGECDCEESRQARKHGE